MLIPTVQEGQICLSLSFFLYISRSLSLYLCSSAPVCAPLWDYTYALEITLTLLIIFRINIRNITLTLTLVIVFELQM